MPQWLTTTSSWVFSELLTRVGFLLALVLLAGLLRQRRSPSSTIAWLLAILLIPYVGVPLYIIFGGRKMRRLARLKEPIYEQTSTARRESIPTGRWKSCLASYGVPAEHPRGTVSSWSCRAKTPTSACSISIERCPVDHPHHDLHSRKGRGEPGSRRMPDGARPPKAWPFACSSTAWARGGLVGGSWLRSSRLAAEVASFMPVLNLFRGRANLRNHRKLVVVDGRIGTDRRHESCLAVHRPAGLDRIMARPVRGGRGTGRIGSRGSLRLGLEIRHRNRPRYQRRPNLEPRARPASSRPRFRWWRAAPTSPATRSTNHCWP